MKRQIISKIYSLLFFSFFASSCFAQVQQHYAQYVSGRGFTICINDSFCYLEEEENDLDLRKINHFKVVGDSLQIREQLENIKRFCDKHPNTRIRILEYENSATIRHLDPLVAEFPHLSILIINNCKNIKLDNIIRYVNRLNNWAGNGSAKAFKKAFKKRPSFFYLNSLIFKNQELGVLGTPAAEIKEFKFLEELRIENPTSASEAQQYVNDLVEHWVVQDTSHYLRSCFPNLRFLGLADCGLDSIPYRMKYKYGLISLDLSGNNLQAIPPFLVDYKNFETMLSLNLNGNNISKLDKGFLDRYTESAEKGSKLAKYLFLSDNDLTYIELKKLGDRNYSEAFNTITFECNPIKFRDLDEVASVLKLAKELDQMKIANFLTGAGRSETDYNPYTQLITNCLNRKE